MKRAPSLRAPSHSNCDLRLRLDGVEWIDRNLLAILALSLELDHAIDIAVQRVVLRLEDVGADVELGSALLDEDAA